MFFKTIFFLFLTFFSPFSLLYSAELKGFVRSVNYEGHSFSVDVPPLQRVKMNASTQFEGETGQEAFKKHLQEGDYVRVEGSQGSNGLWLATKVEVQKNKSESKTNEIQVKFNQSFLLEVLQTAQVEDSNLELYFSQLVDELCDTGMDCVDKGKLTLKIIVKRGSEAKTIELVTEGSRKPIKPVSVEALGFRVELIEVGEYAAMLVVRKS
ncbi:MAG: hypothetical protein HQM15_05295 [Deltaproteobacteria bacterium]|nr:hypothetical protein [Deltaproteobacteria bacterium]